MTPCYWCGYPVDPENCFKIPAFKEHPEDTVTMPIILHWECFAQMGSYHSLPLMKGILIDPFERSVSYVESKFEAQDLRRIVGTDLLDFSSGVFPNRHSVVVADYGAYDASLPTFKVRNYPFAIHGKCLILAYDAQGETVPIKMTVEQVYDLIEFIR
jgi:hypothetical protein